MIRANNKDIKHLFKGYINIPKIIVDNNVIHENTPLNPENYIEFTLGVVSPYYTGLYFSINGVGHLVETTIGTQSNNLDSTRPIRLYISDSAKNFKFFSNSSAFTTSVKSIKISNKTRNITSGLEMFFSLSTVANVENIDLTDFDTSNIVDMFRMFSYLKWIEELDLSNFDTSNVVRFSSMFSNFKSTTLRSLDLSSFTTDKITQTDYMFADCIYLKELNLEKFDLSNIIDVSSNCGRMFYNCVSLSKIKCTTSFRDWCWTNQNAIDLPNALRQSGTGTWQDSLASSSAVANLMKLNTLRASTMQLSDSKASAVNTLGLSDKTTAVKDITKLNQEISRLEESIPISINDEGKTILTLEDNRTIELDDDGFPLGWFEDTSEVGSGTWELVD